MPDWHFEAQGKTVQGKMGTRTPSMVDMRTLTGTYPSCYECSVDAVLQALSDPSRRIMLDALSKGPAKRQEPAGIAADRPSRSLAAPAGSA